MNIAARLLSIVVVATLAVAVVYGFSQVRQTAIVKLDEERPPVNAHPAGIVGQNLGSAGCMGAACHGGPATNTLKGNIDGGTWQSSGSCWVAADPHTNAYAVLTSTKKDQESGRIKVSAEHIMERYAPGTKATDDARCLACHTNPALAYADKNADLATVNLRAEGVSCEACHGSAGGWIRQHTTWNGKRDAVYKETGMNKLYDLGVRALACAGCHVGSPEVNETLPNGTVVKLAVRDMNHDMIAAGHPRLNFDFAEYQRRLPVHWQEKDRDNGGSERKVDVVKAWLVGRVAHAEAACKLTDDRARRSENDRRSPWPEFAEYNCAACHHDLEPGRGDTPGAYARANWRDSEKVLKSRPPGVPAWQAVWPVAPAIGLDPQTPADLFKDASNKPGDAVRQLAELMQAVPPADAPKPRPPARMPGAAAARPKAQAAASVLAALRSELVAWPADRPAPDVAGLARKQEFAPDARDWDSGLQLLFGLAALERSRPRDGPRDVLFRDAFGAYRGGGGTEKERWERMQKAIRDLYPKN